MAKNTIVIKKYLHIHEELIAAGIITPGMLVTRTAANQALAHAGALLIAHKLVAIEDDLQGREIGDNYAVGELVRLWRVTPGEQFYAISDATASGAIVIGDYLESNGLGKLRKVTTGVAIAVALEAVTPGPTSPRFIVEML